MKKEQVCWVAGFFDGEGCVQIQRRQRSKGFIEHCVKAVVGQKKLGPLLEIKDLFGGILTKLTTSGCYQWRAHGKTAERFFTVIRPYLRLKGPEVDCALEIRKTIVLPGNHIGKGVWKKREEIWNKFRSIRECTTS